MTDARLPDRLVPALRVRARRVSGPGSTNRDRVDAPRRSARARIVAARLRARVLAARRAAAPGSSRGRAPDGRDAGRDPEDPLRARAAAPSRRTSGFVLTALGGALYLWRGDERLRPARRARPPRWACCSARSMIVTGPIWARGTWGRWWSWDPRLTVTLLLWFVYLAYLLLRSFTEGSERAARFAAVYGIAGLARDPAQLLRDRPVRRPRHPSREPRARQPRRRHGPAVPARRPRRARRPSCTCWRGASRSRRCARAAAERAAARAAPTRRPMGYVIAAYASSWRRSWRTLAHLVRARGAGAAALDDEARGPATRIGPCPSVKSSVDRPSPGQYKRAARKPRRSLRFPRLPRCAPASQASHRATDLLAASSSGGRGALRRQFADAAAQRSCGRRTRRRSERSFPASGTPVASRARAGQRRIAHAGRQPRGQLRATGRIADRAGVAAWHGACDRRSPRWPGRPVRQHRETSRRPSPSTTTGPDEGDPSTRMASMKRGVGYCENTDCEDYAKGVFLLNHGDTFYCPRCRQLGKVEKERGFYTGNSDIFKEVRVEYNFDPINGVYREIAIVRDESLWGRNNVYTLQSPADQDREARAQGRRGDPRQPEPLPRPAERRRHPAHHRDHPLLRRRTSTSSRASCSSSRRSGRRAACARATASPERFPGASIPDSSFEAPAAGPVARPGPLCVRVLAVRGRGGRRLQARGGACSASHPPAAGASGTHWALRPARAPPLALRPLLAAFARGGAGCGRFRAQDASTKERVRGRARKRPHPEPPAGEEGKGVRGRGGGWRGRCACRRGSRRGPGARGARRARAARAGRRRAGPRNQGKMPSGSASGANQPWRGASREGRSAPPVARQTYTRATWARKPVRSYSPTRRPTATSRPVSSRSSRRNASSSDSPSPTVPPGSSQPRSSRRSESSTPSAPRTTACTIRARPAPPAARGASASQATCAQSGSAPASARRTPTAIAG